MDVRMYSKKYLNKYIGDYQREMASIQKELAYVEKRKKEYDDQMLSLDNDDASYVVLKYLSVLLDSSNIAEEMRVYKTMDDAMQYLSDNAPSWNVAPVGFLFNYSEQEVTDFGANIGESFGSIIRVPNEKKSNFVVVKYEIKPVSLKGEPYEYAPRGIEAFSLCDDLTSAKNKARDYISEVVDEINDRRKLYWEEKLDDVDPSSISEYSRCPKVLSFVGVQGLAYVTIIDIGKETK